MTWITCPHCSRGFDPDPISQELREAQDKEFADLYATGITYKEIGAKFGVTGHRVGQRIKRYAAARRKEIEQELTDAGIVLCDSVRLINRGSSFSLVDDWWRDRTLPNLAIPLPPLEPLALDSIRSFSQQVEQKELDWARKIHVIKSVKVNRKNWDYPKPGRYFNHFREGDCCAIFTSDLWDAREFNSADAAKEFWNNPWWIHGEERKSIPSLTWLVVEIISIADAMEQEQEQKDEGKNDRGHDT